MIIWRVIVIYQVSFFFLQQINVQCTKAEKDIRPLYLPQMFVILLKKKRYFKLLCNFHSCLFKKNYQIFWIHFWKIIYKEISRNIILWYIANRLKIKTRFMLRIMKFVNSLDKKIQHFNFNPDLKSRYRNCSPSSMLKNLKILLLKN